MAINSNLLNYQSQKKKNSLQPYLDAGNASTQPKTGATRVSPTYTPNTVAKTYSAPKTASTAVPLQSAVAKAYNQPAQQSVPAQTAQNVPKATASMTTPTQNTNTPTLQQAYGNVSYNGSYGTARQNALNQAEASYNKLLNYLPEYNELMGMNGLGVSSQALLNAYGTYQNNVNSINAQYDELERAYLDQQINNATNVAINLSDYISGAAGKFTQEGYERFKQGLLEAGYTEQEIAAGEKMLQQNDLSIMDSAERRKNVIDDAIKNAYGVAGNGIFIDDATVGSFGSFKGTGEGLKQDSLVLDILKAAQEGRIKNGSYINFNYGEGNAALYVYYNGYFYPVKNEGIRSAEVIGRGNGSGFDPNDL